MHVWCWLTVVAAMVTDCINQKDCVSNKVETNILRIQKAVSTIMQLACTSKRNVSSI